MLIIALPSGRSVILSAILPDAGFGQTVMDFVPETVKGFEVFLQPFLSIVSMVYMPLCFFAS